jgi:Glycosyltransferase family 28 C-terminal domain
MPWRPCRFMSSPPLVPLSTQQSLEHSANAYVVAFADHDPLMDRTSAVLGHGGHRTTMRALRHGLPIVGIPAKGGDQAPITQMHDRWGVARALPGDPWPRFVPRPRRSSQIRPFTTKLDSAPAHLRTAMVPCLQQTRSKLLSRTIAAVGGPGRSNRPESGCDG